MTANKKIYQVDAFTDTPFKGNPAGVMIIDATMTTDRMQHLALEMNLSETAFILPTENGYQIRYFTPTREVPLCGHATLAAAHILYELGLKDQNDSIAFKAKGGDLTINKANDWIVMQFPKYPLNTMDIPATFKQMIGFEPQELYSSIYDWVIAVAADEDAILNAKPNFEAMKQNGLGHLMITAKSVSDQADFVVRCFAPSSGINEDPVTGSAHCALTPLWSKKLGKVSLDAVQVSKRTGRLKLTLIDNTVEIKGKAVTIFEADLKI